MLEYLVILKCVLSAGLCIVPMPYILTADSVTISEKCIAIPTSQDDNVEAQSCAIDFDNGTVMVKDTDRPNQEFFINLGIQEDDTAARPTAQPTTTILPPIR